MIKYATCFRVICNIIKIGYYPMQYKKCNRVECVVREKKQRFVIKVKK